MDTSIFDAYQEELVKNTAELQSFIDNLKECGNREDRKRAAVQACDDSIGKISTLLKEMEMEVRTYGSQLKRTCTESLNKHKDDVSTLKSQYNTTKFAIEKASLTGTRSGEDRRRLIDANEKYGCDIDC
jgi:chromosome segregation ATPase